jgi:hypothetical protein
MNKERFGDFLITHTRKKFYPLDPRPEEIDIEDIAHALSNLCRYGGHASTFFSVSEHSVIISDHSSPKNKLWSLLHDATEAYLVDIPRPIKPFLTNYKDYERKLMDCVCEKFGLSLEEPEEVKALDTGILIDEMEQLMDYNIVNSPYPRLGVKIQCLPPVAAKSLFLETFRSLT